MLDHHAGCTWRPLQGTATSVLLLYGCVPEWSNWRRTADYYPEGFLIWLEVDTLIRQQTHGQKSLNDFCGLFYGGASGPPVIVPHKFGEGVAARHQDTPHNWAGLLRQRLGAKYPHTPRRGVS